MSVRSGSAAESRSTMAQGALVGLAPLAPPCPSARCRSPSLVVGDGEVALVVGAIGRGSGESLANCQRAVIGQPRCLALPQVVLQVTNSVVANGKAAQVVVTLRFLLGLPLLHREEALKSAQGLEGIAERA